MANLELRGGPLDGLEWDIGRRRMRYVLLGYEPRTLDITDPPFFIGALPKRGADGRRHVSLPDNVQSHVLAVYERHPDGLPIAIFVGELERVEPEDDGA